MKDLIASLADAAKKHELISTQIQRPDLDFFLYTVPVEIFKLPGNKNTYFVLTY